MTTIPNRAAGRRPRRRPASRGLTLVELVIVITIIGVLTAAIPIGVLEAQKKANVGAAKTACSTVRQATMQWKAFNPAPTARRSSSSRPRRTSTRASA